jgi:hypothetical protein
LNCVDNNGEVIMNRYVNKIAIAMCFLGLSFSVGCIYSQREWDEFWSNEARQWQEVARTPSNIPSSTSGGFDDGYWQMEHEMEKLRRIEREEALEGARIREHTRRMLKRME